MKPLMFRGSILIADKVLSYSDFMNMPYHRFCQIEATYKLVNELKYKDVDSTSSKTTNKSEVKRKLSGLPTISQDELTEEQRRFLNAS